MEKAENMKELFDELEKCEEKTDGSLHPFLIIPGTG